MQKERAVHRAQNTFITFFLFTHSLVFCSVLFASPNSKPFPSVYYATGYWYNISLSFKQFIIFHFPAFRFNVPPPVHLKDSSSLHFRFNFSLVRLPFWFWFYFYPLHVGDAMLLCFLTQQLIRIASHRYVCAVVLHFAIFLISQIQIESRLFVLVGLYFSLFTIVHSIQDTWYLLALNRFQKIASSDFH